MKIFLYILLSVFSFLACQPEPLDVKLEEYQPQIVVASQVIPDYLMVVGLTRSFSVLSAPGFEGEGNEEVFETLLIDSAEVTVESANGVDTLFKVADGLYASLNELQSPGGSYILKVKDYDLNQSVKATSTMLANVPFDAVVPTFSIDGGDTNVYVGVKFTDLPDIQNQYVLSIYSRNTNEEGIDVNVFFESGSNRVEYQELIEDRNIDGQVILRNIKLSNVTLEDSLMVSLSNISEGYYSFLKSRERSGNLLSEITNEPINYPSNVEGGLGYFNTHYPSIQFFDLKQLLD